MAATGAHAPWRLWILIVLWVLQLLLLIGSLIIYIAAFIAVGRSAYGWEDAAPSAIAYVSPPAPSLIHIPLPATGLTTSIELWP
jgi:hypothetical protein